MCYLFLISFFLNRDVPSLYHQIYNEKISYATKLLIILKNIQTFIRILLIMIDKK